MAKNFLDNYTIAHRGIYDNKSIYENTIPAFKKAMDNNFAIELDVRLTNDGKLIVFHDHNLKRLVNKPYIVKNSTYQELKNDIINIPTLNDVLKQVKGKVPIIIEIKSERNIKKIVDTTVEVLSNYKGEYHIKSFDYKIIKYLKKKYPEISRGLLLSSKKDKLKLSLIYKVFIAKPNFISCNKKLLETKQIKSLRKRMPIIAWTVDTNEENKRIKEYCDNTICDVYKMKGNKL